MREARRSRGRGIRGTRCDVFFGGLFLALLIFGLQGYGQDSDLLSEGRKEFYEGNLPAAVTLLERYVSLSPDSRQARILLARALAGQGESDKAFEQLKTVLGRDPENVDALFYLAALSSALSQREFQELYRRSPDSARVHQLMGDSLYLRRSFDEAEEEFLKAVEKDPGLTEVWVNLGDLKRTQGEFAGAAEYYEKALERSPKAADALYGLGVCLRFQQDEAGAIRRFREALEAEPGLVAARLALGTSLVRQGEFDEARTHLLQVIRERPQTDQAYFQLGRAYQGLGQREKAREAFDQARRLSAP